MGACTAVSADDLHLTLGVNFRGGQETSAGRQSTCDYVAGSAQVSVSIQRVNGPIDLAAEIEALKQELPGARCRMLDAATFAVEIPAAGVQVHSLRGGRDYIMISILGLGDGVGSAAQRLARIASARL
jgi:hypothetical protein